MVTVQGLSVIHGDQQVNGLDYNKTFPHVTKMSSVRCFLSVEVSKESELHQLNINNTFLHGDLDGEMYMKSPPGFTCSSLTKECYL